MSLIQISRVPTQPVLAEVTRKTMMNPTRPILLTKLQYHLIESEFSALALLYILVNIRHSILLCQRLITGQSLSPISRAIYLVFLLQYLSLICVYSDTPVLFDSTLVYHAVGLLQIHSFLCVERFDNRPNPTKEPRLRALVRNENKSIVLLSGLVGKTDSCVFHCHSLNNCKR